MSNSFGFFLPSFRKIRIIGYFPVEIDSLTFRVKITIYRYVHGMTPKEFGRLILADASTVRSWEERRLIPHLKKRLKIGELIKKGLENNSNS